MAMAQSEARKGKEIFSKPGVAPIALGVGRVGMDIVTGAKLLSAFSRVVAAQRSEDLSLSPSLPLAEMNHALLAHCLS